MLGLVCFVLKIPEAQIRLIITKPQMIFPSITLLTMTRHITPAVIQAAHTTEASTVVGTAVVLMVAEGIIDYDSDIEPGHPTLCVAPLL
jgi:hypothetical protein